MRRLLFALAVASLTGCDLSTGVEDQPTDPATEIFAPGLKVNIPAMTKTVAGTYYQDLKVGSGTPVAGIPDVVISYLVYLKDGTLVASVPASTKSLGLLIPGIRDAMQGMAPGGERLIVVPSALAYGNANTVPGIPPNSTLVFDLIFNAYPLQ
jgi:FKBP-type peptidyl-prolyl cis-trans isomerase